MSGYKSPGVTIKSIYEPLISPVVGGDRQMAIVGEVVLNNLNLYPTAIYEVRKGTTTPDASTASIWENRLGTIADASRVKRVWQGATTFDAATADYSATITRGGGTSDTKDFAGVLALTPAEQTETVPNDDSFTVAFTTGYAMAAVVAPTTIPANWAIYGGATLIEAAGTFNGATVSTITYTATTAGVITVTVNTAGTFTGGPFDFALYTPELQYAKLYVLGDDGVIYTPTVTFTENGSGDLFATLDWTGITETITTYTLTVGDDTVDYAYIVDDTTDPDGIILSFYWNSLGNAPVNGSAYLYEVLLEYPQERGIYTSQDEVQKTFGPLIDPTNPDFTDVTAVNKLVLASYLAFKEGAPSVILVPYGGSTTAETALGWLAADDTVNIVVGVDSNIPTAGGVTLNDFIVTHVLECSSEQVEKFRVGLFNPTVSTTFTTAYNSYTAISQYLNSIRLWVIGPSQFTFSIPLPVTGEYKDFKADGAYGAVVYAAMMCRPEYDLATAMLRKDSRSINKIRQAQEWDDRKMDMVAALGITLIAKITGSYKVRDDITTNQDGLLLKNEPSITMVADNLSKSAIASLDAAIIGGKLKIPTTLEVVKSRLISMLYLKMADDLISGFGTPIVTVATTDPRKILVAIPVVPYNKTREILVTFSYVTSV